MKIKNRALICLSIIICLFCCSCSKSIDKDMDFINEALPEEQKALFSGVVTLELLESIVGELTYEYTPIISAYKTDVYKGVDGKDYELEFLTTADGVREIVACRSYLGDDSTLIFCKKTVCNFVLLI